MNGNLQNMDVIVLPDGRMDAKNAASYCGLSVKTLAMKRCDGTGPKFVKLGRVFYFRSDLDAWWREIAQPVPRKRGKRHEGGGMNDQTKTAPVGNTGAAGNKTNQGGHDDISRLDGSPDPLLAWFSLADKDRRFRQRRNRCRRGGHV